MKAKVGPNKSVPIANGGTKPSASGPSASPSHGTGAPFAKPSATPARLPNTSLVAETIATVSTPPAQDYGKGQTAPIDVAVKSEGDYNPSTSPRP